MLQFNSKYSLLKKFILFIISIIVGVSSYAQTNEKIKAKEIEQVKQINKDYDKSSINKKREEYIKQTRKQRESRGNEVAKSRGEKESEYINKTSGQRTFKGKEKKPPSNKSLANEIRKNSGGDIKAGTPQEREYKQVEKSKDARNFSGNTKNETSSYKEENTKNMGNYSGDKKYYTRGEKEAAQTNRSKGMREFSGRTKTGSQEYLTKREENKKTMNKYSSGDEKYYTRGEKEAAYIDRTKGQREFQGRERSGQLSHLAKKEQNKKDMENAKNFSTSGDMAFLKKREQNKKEMEGYQGNVRPDDFEFLKKRAENKKEMEKYASGDLAYMTKGQKENAYLKRTNAMRTFQGNIDRNNLYHLENRARLKDEMEKYSSGDIEWRDLEKREKQRREKAKKMAQFSGSVLVKDIEKWQKSIRKKEKDIANFQGNIKIAKRKEGQHPSAAYKGGYIANSYTQKAKMRKKMLKKYGRKSDIDMPAHLKDKPKKAKYSKDESEIWW